MQSIEQDFFQASLNKLRREAMERSADVSELSDGYLSPGIEDTESVCSDIFGEYDDGLSDRQRKRSQLMRLDENSEMLAPPPGPTAPIMGGTRARPVTRRSISRELFDERPRQSLARPLVRRSVSRDLCDVDFTPTPSVASSR